MLMSIIGGIIYACLRSLPFSLSFSRKRYRLRLMMRLDTKRSMRYMTSAMIYVNMRMSRTSMNVSILPAMFSAMPSFPSSHPIFCERNSATSCFIFFLFKTNK